MNHSRLAWCVHIFFYQQHITMRHHFIFVEPRETLSDAWIFFGRVRGEGKNYWIGKCGGNLIEWVPHAVSLLRCLSNVERKMQWKKHIGRKSTETETRKKIFKKRHFFTVSEDNLYSLWLYIFLVQIFFTLCFIFWTHYVSIKNYIGLCDNLRLWEKK